MQAETANSTFDGIVNMVRESVLQLWNEFLGHIPHLAGALILLLIVWLFARLVDRATRGIMYRSKMRASLQQVIGRLVNIGVWLVGLLVIATIVVPGITISKAIGGLGIVSIAVGFAFRDIFENFFAGILLLWRFPFENGDVIECEGYVGTVLRINIRMTELRTLSGEHLILPNAFLYKNPVQVLTNRSRRRVEITTGIAYGEDVATAVEVLREAMKNCETVDAGYVIDVMPKGYGSSSIDIDLVWWTSAKPLEQRRSVAEVVTATKKALDDAGIEIPFPYRTLTFKHPLQMHPVQGPGAGRDEGGSD
ncbi:MAG: mechanosensitive ion channel family protein [Gammaproteobacteria bacterium]|nr:mechanosensitive ion channel family protein [Gammaproteobacteria bacterium]